MERLIGTLFVGALFAVGYVVFTDGLSGEYIIGGDAGFVMSGGRLILSSLALLTGFGVLAGARKGDVIRFGVGLALVGFVGWSVVSAFGEPARTEERLDEKAAQGSEEAQICLAVNDLISMARAGSTPPRERVTSDMDSIRAAATPAQFLIGKPEGVRDLAANLVFHWDRNFDTWFADTLTQLGTECRKV